MCVCVYIYIYIYIYIYVCDRGVAEDAVLDDGVVLYVCMHVCTYACMYVCFSFHRVTSSAYTSGTTMPVRQRRRLVSAGGLIYLRPCLTGARVPGVCRRGNIA